MKYAKIEDGSIASISSLPTVYRNVSGFDGLSDAELAVYGFLPYYETKAEYDPATHKLTAGSFEILADRVNIAYTAVALTTEELEAIEVRKWEVVRNTRNSLLEGTDWTQLLDSPITTEKRDEYTVYRQTLRDIPQTFANADDVVFPDPVA